MRPKPAHYPFILFDCPHCRTTQRMYRETIEGPKPLICANCGSDLGETWRPLFKLHLAEADVKRAMALEEGRYPWQEPSEDTFE